MLRVTVLGSGSRGNAILLDGARGSLLIDAGFGTRMLSRKLEAVGRAPEHISSLLLTHEHTDHSSGALNACRKWSWTLRSSSGTLAALEVSDHAGGDNAVSNETFDSRNCTQFDDWHVQAVRVPHDARDCRAFVITSMESGARVGVALDLGHVPATLISAFAKLDLLVVESNHDLQMLARGPYPWMLKRRVGGEDGHLSNDAAAAFIAECSHRGLRGVLLAHLSQVNNTPEFALSCARTALRRAGWRRNELMAAHQVSPVGPIGMTGLATSHSLMQLSLEL